MIDGKAEKHSYAELAEEYIAEAVNSNYDWSIFEHHQLPILMKISELRDFSVQ